MAPVLWTVIVCYYDPYNALNKIPSFENNKRSYKLTAHGQCVYIYIYMYTHIYTFISVDVELQRYKA